MIFENHGLGSGGQPAGLVASVLVALKISGVWLKIRATQQGLSRRRTAVRWRRPSAAPTESEDEGRSFQGNLSPYFFHLLPKHINYYALAGGEN